MKFFWPLVFAIYLPLSAPRQSDGKVDLTSLSIFENQAVRSSFSSPLRVKLLEKFHLAVFVSDSIGFVNLSDGSRNNNILALDINSKVDQIAATKDESKIIIAVSHRNHPRKNHSIWGGGGDTLWNFESEIYCYSNLEKQFLWKIETPDIWFYDYVGITANDSLIFGFGRNKSIVLNLSDGSKTQRKIPNIKYGKENVVFSDGGRYILHWNKPSFKTVNLHSGSNLSIWDVQNNSDRFSVFIPHKGTWSATFTSDRNGVLVGNYDGSLQLWTFEKKQLSSIWSSDETGKKDDPITNIVTPQATGNFLAVTTLRKNETKIFQYPMMSPIISIKDSFGSSDIGTQSNNQFFSNDGRQLLFLTSDFLCLFETQDWNLLWKLKLE